MKKNNESMSKFDKLVKITKIQIEKEILDDAKFNSFLRLHDNVKDAIRDLSFNYYNLQLKAGYSSTTAYRKYRNWDINKLISKLEIWYKTELLPKLWKRFENENKTINWYPKVEDIKINENKIMMRFEYFAIYKRATAVYGMYNFRLSNVEPEEQAKAEALLNKLVKMGIYEYNGPMYALEEELKEYE